MARLVRFSAPRTAEVVEVEDPAAGPGEVLLKTAYSGISAGSDQDAALVGRLVWGAWGHRSDAVRPVEYVRPRLLPDGAEPITGVFAKIGAIALNAVLDADIHVGETVAAVRTAGYSARVVASGFFQGDASGLRLGEEFHHNRVAIVGSQISGVAPHLQHRWDELRMATTVLALERAGRLALTDLISHIVPADDAPKAFEMLDTAPQNALQIVLEYGADS